jgi:FkbM family methyltransferase
MRPNEPGGMAQSQLESGSPPVTIVSCHPANKSAPALLDNVLPFINLFVTLSLSFLLPSTFMDLLWLLMKWNQRLKQLLPACVIRWIRSVLESLDVLWWRKYYGQFGEDAVVQNILRERNWRKAAIGGATKIQRVPGFYVDIGAFAPIQHSNTWWFYKHGWRGINIDATPGSMKIFHRVRPRDINLELAVSSREGEITYYTWGIPNVMNTVSEECAQQVARQSGQSPQKFKIQAHTLEHILNEHLPSGQAIDFFSVDVENHNLEVLRSNNWKKYRPHLVVVEADAGCETFDTVANSEMLAFMKDQHYQVCGWTKPSLIFEQEASSCV